MRTTILLIFGVISFTSSAQDYGYFGNKNTLSVSGIGTIPLYYALYNINKQNYKKSGSQISEKRDLFDGGFNISYSHSFRGNVGIGLEFSQLYTSISCPIENFSIPYYSSYYTFRLKYEELDLRTNLIMPKIEFSFNSKLLPIGINHQLGVGYTSTSVINKEYIAKYSVDLEANQGTEYNKVIIHKDNFIDFDKLKSIKGITVMYGFNARKPIGRHLAVNYGIRYTLNLKLPKLYEPGYGDYYTQDFEEDKRPLGYYLSSERIDQEIRSKRIRSIIAFQFGLNYIF